MSFIEDDILYIDIVSYGLYEDLYKGNTYSVEDAYEDYWKEKE